MRPGYGGMGGRIGRKNLKGTRAFRRVELLREVNQLAHQIVVVRFRNSYASHFSGSRFARTKVVDVAEAVDFRGLGRKPPLPKQIRLARRALHENRQLLPD